MARWSTLIRSSRLLLPRLSSGRSKRTMKVLILGASGLVGSNSLEQALAHPSITEVIAPLEGLCRLVPISRIRCPNNWTSCYHRSPPGPSMPLFARWVRLLLKLDPKTHFDKWITLCRFRSQKRLTSKERRGLASYRPSERPSLPHSSMRGRRVKSNGI
jgi:hypothetical protein